MERRKCVTARHVQVWKDGVSVRLALTLATIATATTATTTTTGIPFPTRAAAQDDTAAEPVPEDLEEGLPDAEDAPLTPCQTELRLSGTFYNSRRPERSFATFHVTTGRAGEMYRVGERIGGFEIVSVGPRTVVLNDGGPGCYLKLAGAPAPAKKNAKKPKKPAAKKAKKKAKPKSASKNAFSKEELDEAIRSLGPKRFEVRQDLLSKVLERSAKLTRTTGWRQVRGVSHVKGMRLSRLSNDGLLARLGLQKGDVIKTLNGLQLSSLEGALEAQKLVGSAKNLSLLIQRNGKTTTLEYQIVH